MFVVIIGVLIAVAADAVYTYRVAVRDALLRFDGIQLT